MSVYASFKSLISLGIDFERIPCWLYSVVSMQAFELSTLFSWVVHFLMICISRTCFISYWDYIHITCVHEDDKGIRNFIHLSQKANLKHIILSESLLSLFIFSLLYPCVSLNFLYVFLFPWPRISIAYTCWYLVGLWLEIMWKEKKVMLDEKNGQSCQRWKRKVFHCVLEILCWLSLKSKEVLVLKDRKFVYFDEISCFKKIIFF